MRPSVYDTIALRAMLALCALLPFFFIPLSWVTIPQSKVVLTALLLGVAAISWLLARYKSYSVRIPQSGVIVSALLIPLAYAISALSSGFSTLSLVGSGVEQDTLVASILACSALILAVFIFSEQPKSGLTAIRAFSLGVLALVGIEFIHLLFPGFPLASALGGAAGNAFGNRHELGLIFGLTAYLGVALSDSALGEERWRYVFLALSAASVLLLVVIDLPDVWGALAVLAFLTLGYEWSWRAGPERRSARRRGLWLALGTVSLLFVFFGSIVWNVLPAPLRVANVEIRPSWQGTLSVGREALNKPATLVFGAGPNTFMREWNLYKPAAVNQTQFWNTDFDAGVGTVPTSFITLGLIGFLAWITFIGAFLWMFFSRVRRPPRLPGDPVFFAVGLASSYLLTFHVLYAPQAALNILTFLFAGTYIALAVEAGDIRSLPVRITWNGWREYIKVGVAGASGLALVVAGILALRVNAANALVNRSIQLYGASQDIGQAAALIRGALFVYQNSDRAHRAGVELGILELQRLAASPDAASASVRAQLQSTLQDTIQHGLAAVSIDSGDYQNWLELAILYQNLAGANVQGAETNARAAYLRALSADPKDPMLYFRMAQLDVLEKKNDAALADVQSALALKPDFAAAYYLASQIYTSKNDLGKAKEAAESAVQYAPDDKLGWYNAGVIAYAQGDWQSAATDEEQAIARDPQYANAFYVLGLSYYELQRPADSMAAFQVLAKLDPGEAAVTQILSNLEAGRPPLGAAPAMSPTTTPAKK